VKTTSLILVSLVVFAVLAGAGCQASPPEPAQPAADAIVTVDDFQGRIAAIEQADAAQAQALADSLWQSLTAQGRIPLLFGERVFFLYKGAANSVTWRGDFTGWESGPGLEGKRVGDSDLWMAETTLPVDARANYKIVLDGKDWILDPANPLIQPGGLGDNNILAMPEFTVTTDTARRDDVASGTLSDDLTIESENLGYAVNYQVYTPAGYEELSGLPVVYVTDGNDWVYEPYGAMAVVLDNLIADGRIEPVMAVFIDAREPGNPQNNRREQEFLDHSEAYARFVAEELVSAIDQAYRTAASAGARVIQGTSYGGVIATYIQVRFPEVFQKAAIFSPAYGVLGSPAADPVRADSMRRMNDTFTGALACGGDTGIPCPELPPTYFMSWGIPSWDVGDLSGTAANLQGVGVPIRAIQTQEGHNWGQWSGLLDEMLTYFFAAPLTPGATVPLAPDAVPMIVDTDMAPDDWMAILYLLMRPDVDVQAITVAGTGEVHCETGVRHAMNLAALAGRPQIPVACGSDTPLAGDRAFPGHWRSRADTLAGLELPANPATTSDQDAVAMLMDTLHASPEPVTVVTLGPLTNLAEALQADPALAGQIEEVYVMGGAFDVPGNVGLSGVGIDNTAAEWNLYVDPRAAAVVLQSGAPLTFVPLDATNQTPITPAFYNRLADNRATPAAEFVYQVLTTQLSLIKNGLYWFWDPLTAVVSTDPGVARTAERRVTVIEQEGSEVGATRVTREGAPARVVTAVDATRFEEQFLDTLNASLP
jgi:inosine-uridine nucleoside N-ribohydrolase/enterochelin esterase-like enzyme